MDKYEILYEGKSKKVFRTDDSDLLLVDYKDDSTESEETDGKMIGKRAVNNRMSNYIFRLLEEKGIPTHYVQELSDTQTVVKKAEMLPFEVTIRNVAAGSFSKKMGIEEGFVLLEPTLEFCYKNDTLGNPMINDFYIIAIGAATREEISRISDLAFQVNDVLKDLFIKMGIRLIDFKLEFGRYKGQIILADEISPDTCRLWDLETDGQLDENYFQKDFSNSEGKYQEVFRHLGL